MKVSFSREVMYYPEWNGNRELPEGERVLARLKPLTMGDLIKLMDTLQAASGGKIDAESLTALDATKDIQLVQQLIAACGDLVPRYCTVEGLTDETGPVDVQQLVEFPFYMDLTAELLTELGNISMPTEAEEKNSEPQPDTAPTTTQ